MTAASLRLHFSHQPVWQAGVVQKREIDMKPKKTAAFYGFLIAQKVNKTLHFSSPTCPVSSVVEIDGKGARFVLCLPGRRGAVLVVGVSVVVVDVLARQHGGP